MNDEGDMGIMMFKSHWRLSGAVSLAAMLAAGAANAQSAPPSAEQMDKLQAQGNTIVLVTHEHDIAEYAHRVVYIKDGVVERDEVKN